MTTFWLIRHGETAWNAQRRLQGWRDVPLNDTGLRQARQLARVLRPPHPVPQVDAVFASDLSRAAQTARIASVHFHRDVILDAALRERSFGNYEGRELDTLRDAAGAPIRFYALDKEIVGGETRQQFCDRIRSAFLALAKGHPAQTLLVFSHGGVIDMVWRLATGADLGGPRTMPILNTSLNAFRIDGQGGWQLLDWGYVPHLDAQSSTQSL